MTIIRAFTLRNIMIILCIIMLVLLGDKTLGIRSKIQDVREAGRLYSSEQSMKDLENSPIWQAMEAVQKGHVYSLKTADFVVGEGLAGTPLFLDYLIEKLVP